jgi:HSP20 family protein
MRASTRNPWGQMFNQMEQLQQDMSRLFGRWASNGGAEFTRTTSFPIVNVWEDVENLHIEAELPGVDLKDLEIYVNAGNQLTIKGQRKQPEPGKGQWHRQERAFGTFVRTLSLPFVVNSEKVEAKLENGVLLLDLAKHESAKARKIAVQGE